MVLYLALESSYEAFFTLKMSNFIALQFAILFLPVIQDEIGSEQPASWSPVHPGLCSEPLKKLQGAKAVDCETPIIS